MNVQNEWLIAIALFALPVLFLAALEVAAVSRRRRERAIAQRRKGPTRRWSD